MSHAELAAARSKGPFSNGTDNTGELRIATGASASLALPLAWASKYVELLNESATAAEFIAYTFSLGAGQTVTVAAAAANGAPGVSRGRLVKPGERVKVLIPGIMTGGQGGPVTQGQAFINTVAASGTPTLSISLVE
jgi:hypothetical protein